MIGRTLAHYRIREKLGEGGMGQVYLAEDTRLRRGVALKVLPDNVSSDPGRLARFRREAEAVAALNHPGIVTIYSIEEFEGVHFLIMELVEGKSLDRLTPEGGVEVKLLLDVATRLASALAAAHARGVAHRDLKPANVMVTADGQVKVLDFGLAKFAEREEDLGDETATEALTQDGIVMGTVPYMSPEQIEGKPIDQRTDIFSLGVVLYELASGTKPFRGGSPAARMASTLKETPVPLTEVRPGLPVRLWEIVERCLAKRPDRRYPTANELHEDLKSLKQEVVSGSGPVSVADQKTQPPKSIAVLPFANLSTDPENEYFSDGMTEEIINALTQFKDLRVAARTSSFSFKGKSPTVAEVAAQLNVDTVLEGSVRKAGNRLRVTAQLIEAADGYQMWSERYDREMDDVFAVQDEIASAITRKLQVTLGADQAPAAKRRGTDNPEAYDLYLRGRFHWEQRGDGLLKGLQFFEKALELDPDYALAHTGVADVNSMWAFYGVKPSEDVLPQAREAADKALAIDDTSPEAHTALGVAALQGWDFETAEAEFVRAIEIDPRYSSTRYWYGFHVLQLIHGKTDEGIEQCRLGLEADPFGTYPQLMIGIALTVGERFDEARPHLERAVSRDPSNFFTHRTVGMHALLEGRYDDAIRSFDKSVELSGHPWPVAERGVALAFSGREDRARKVQEGMERQAEVSYVSPFALSFIPTALGETDRALSYLERAYEVRDPVLYVLGHWPIFKPLRGDPRFQSIMRRVGLPETSSA